jgi:hypothetical protein
VLSDDEGTLTIAGDRPSNYTKFSPDGTLHSANGGVASKELLIPSRNGLAPTVFRGSDDTIVRVSEMIDNVDGTRTIKGLEITSTTSATTVAAYTGFQAAMAYKTARDEQSKEVIVESLKTASAITKMTFSALTGIALP